jgi:hypothetical protein
MRILSCIFAILIGVVSAHVMWTCPSPRVSDAGLKAGPCGGVGDLTSTSQMVVNPGPFSVLFQEVVYHQGAPFRIALSIPGEDYFEECVLMNHIPHNDGGHSGQYYAVTFQIPNFYCPLCALQIIQVMTDKIQYNLASGVSTCTYNPNDTTNWQGAYPNQCGSDYHSCTNIMINGTGTFDSTLCLQPDGWNMGTGKGQYDYVYGNEAGAWTQGYLMDTRAPDSVRTLSNSSCTNQILTTLGNPPSNNVGQGTTTSSNSGYFQSGPVVFIIIFTGFIIGASAVIYIYNKRQSKAESYIVLPPWNSNNNAPKSPVMKS